MIVNINNSRIESSKNKMVSNIRYAEKKFDISLMANLIDNLSFDHILKSELNIGTCKEWNAHGILAQD